MRWTAKRKAQLVEQVSNGDVTLETALTTHGISLEEFTAWRRDYAAGGKALLKATVARGVDYAKKDAA